MTPLWLTRRSFFKGASAFAALPLARHATRAFAASPRGILAFIGTYTSSPSEPYSPSGNGEGIYRAWLDPHTGELNDVSLAIKARNPSWLCVHPSRRFLYAISEAADFAGGSGFVTAYALDASSGALTPLNTVSSQGAGPAHMSLDRSGRFAFVANYNGGTVAVLPIAPDGTLKDATDVRRDEGHLGAPHAASAPRGSFAISGHDAPHAHMIAADPGNRFILSTDLGQDRIYIDRFDPTTGNLIPSKGTPIVNLPSGDGPRHFVFHPNGKWFYLLLEEASTLAFFHYDAAEGSLHHVQTISSLPAGFAGTSFGSEIAITPDGKSLYAANRLHDSIAVCSIADDGRLALKQNVATGGDYPRHIALAPDGVFLFSCNQHGDNIATFRRAPSTGTLSPAGIFAAVGSPAMIAFVA